MKTKLPVGLCVLIALALVAFGLLYGTYAGFSEDRAEVNYLLESENGLLTVLGYRGADGCNLGVVARRHLSASDTDVVRLETAARILQDASAPLGTLESADEELQSAVEAVSGKLQQTASFQQSERDQKYLDMLIADLNSLAASSTVTAYNRAASAFNDQLSSPVVGALARLMGVDFCPLFQ